MTDLSGGSSKIDDCEENESFYDVESFTSSESFNSSESFSCSSYELATTAPPLQNLIISALLPTHPQIQELLQSNSLRCQKYLEEYFSMQADTIEWDSSGFNEVLSKFYTGNLSRMQSISSIDSLDMHEISMNPIFSREEEEDKKGGLFKEFMALIFPDATAAFKRVEYRPKSKLLTPPQPTHKTNQKSPSPSSSSSSFSLLYKLLELYCDRLGGHLEDLFPKCVNHFLLQSLKRDLPSRLLEQFTKTTTNSLLICETIKTEIGKIERILHAIEGVILE